MDDEYNLDTLIDKFTVHAEIAKKRWVIESEKFPDAEQYKPENYFNLGAALLCICKEIKRMT